jgi:hypothetical protein
MILVQALSQPMVTKKCRENFAATFCVAERQQPAISPEARSGHRKRSYFSMILAFSASIQSICGGSVQPRRFPYGAPHRRRIRLPPSGSSIESCFLARSRIVKSNKWNYSYQ